MGRPPLLGTRPMTNAERQQRHRERRAAVVTPDQIVAGVVGWLDFAASALPVDAVPAVLDQLAAEITRRQKAHRYSGGGRGR